MHLWLGLSSCSMTSLRPMGQPVSFQALSVLQMFHPIDSQIFVQTAEARFWHVEMPGR